MKYIYILLLVPLNLYMEYNKPCGQHYSLIQNTPVWFYIPDQLCWTRGETIYLWGYYPVIFSKDLNKTFEFNEVEWMIGNE